MRGGFALVLTAWASACSQQQAATVRPTPQPTALPIDPTPLLTTAQPRATAYPAPNAVAAPSAYPAPNAVAAPSAYPAPIPPTAPVVQTVVPTKAQFSGARAFEKAAAQMQWVPRDTGSPGWAKCGDYIAAEFAAVGWAIENQHFDYQGIQCRNIIAKRGSGPTLIIGAHYDARRRADRDPDPAKVNQPVPAANDGASGIAVLLELARVLKPEELGHEIWLAAFDAEDNGELDNWEWIVGSTRLADSLTITPAAVMVIDMIGDADQNIYYEQTSDVGIRTGVWQVANELGYDSFITQPKYPMIDDHSPFLRRNYRAIDIIDFDYPYWHTTHDTLDKISPTSLEAVGKTLEEWLLRGLPGV